MKNHAKLALAGLVIATLFVAGCNTKGPTENPAASKQTQSSPAENSSLTIGGEPVVTLTRPRGQAQDKPQFLQAQVLPGRGMNLFQVRAFVPGQGEINVLASPSLEDAKQLLDNGDDAFGNKNFSLGGAILVPYPNRIRGKLSADGKTITTQIAGKTVDLPANWKGKKGGAEPHAMHGLMLNAHFQNVQQQSEADGSSVSADWNAGNFDGHWLSSTKISVKTTLRDNAVEMEVTAKNVGEEPLPIAIGWHPYFAFPSKDRTQGRLHIPATQRAIVDNYDNVFPAGKIVPVKGTPYDFTPPEGRALDNEFLDDSFTNLQRQSNGDVVIELTDPKASYGLRIIGLSKKINAVQVYAPTEPEKQFAAIEPQFNLGDPYGKEWHGRDTGMVLLKPGDSVTYKVRLELFVPGASKTASK
ncbi:MAG TPA: aldose 1-epimerase [Terriglobales bacterium]